MTNVPTPTWGSNGFIVPSTPAILAGVQEDIDAAFGGGLNPALTTPQGQLATSLAAVIANVDATFLYYTNQVDPAYAQGRMQDAIARIYFLERNPAQPTAVQVLCTGLAGVVIPVGSLALATDGNQYICTEAGVIPVGGSITLSFACVVPGPIPCAAGTLNQIYQAIPGWDSVTNVADGILGNDVESRAAFETRRAATVAANSIGSLPSVLGVVYEVDNVLDVYVTENVSNSPQNIGGVVLNANSLYVAVVGGAAADVAHAIWSRKAPGCAYNGNTTVTVLDTSPQYVPPYPAYSVSFETPPALPVIFDVNIANSAAVPADAVTQIQNAIISAFAGGDGGPRARIGSQIFASRFYAPVMALGAWAQIISLNIGSPNTPAATLTGSIAGTTLTVSAVASGALISGLTLVGALPLVVGTTIVNQISGTPNGVGTYTVSNTQTVGSETMQAVNPNLDSVSVLINQAPTVAASDVYVTVT